MFDKIKEFEALVTNDVGGTIGTLLSDNGGEYISREFESYLKSKGIRHELTIPHTPQQNGVAERMSARSIIAHARLPNSYWAEAVFAAAYLKIAHPPQHSRRWQPHMSGGMEDSLTSAT